jgi:hypothetical protein
MPNPAMTDQATQAMQSLFCCFGANGMKKTEAKITIAVIELEKTNQHNNDLWNGTSNFNLLN